MFVSVLTKFFAIRLLHLSFSQLSTTLGVAVPSIAMTYGGSSRVKEPNLPIGTLLIFFKSLLKIIAPFVPTSSPISSLISSFSLYHLIH